MTRGRLFQIGVAGLLFAALPATARAATDPPLAPALDGAVFRIFHRLTLAVAGEASPEALAARREVEEALCASGHDVVVRSESVAQPPDRALLEDIKDRDGASALVLVQAGTRDAPNTLSVSLYNLGGSRLFAFSGRLLTPVEPRGPVVPIDSRFVPFLQGPALYRALGRSDLADRYESRRLAKNAFRVAGGVIATVAVVIGIIDVIFTGLAGAIAQTPCFLAAGSGDTTSCPSGPQASDVPWLIALGGIVMLIAPSFVSTDPLTPSERQALIDGTTSPRARPSLSIAPAPLPGGGGLVIGGRF